MVAKVSALPDVEDAAGAVIDQAKLIGRDGKIISSTVAQSVSPLLLKEISQQILAVFKGAHKARVQFSELVVNYEAFKITARELRGGAMIFLSPKTTPSTQP